MRNAQPIPDVRAPPPQVNAAANALAHLLVEQHCMGRDVAVGILLERSFPAVVAMLAVLKVPGE